MQAETRYAQLGRDRITYQVLGQGPPDLVMTTASFCDIDVACGGWHLGRSEDHLGGRRHRLTPSLGGPHPTPRRG
jgi:hypothetical protein